MSNSYQKASQAMQTEGVGILRNWAAIDKERQQLEMRTQLTENERQYKQLMQDLASEPGNYEEYMTMFTERAGEILAESQGKVKGGFASRYFPVQAQEQLAQYEIQARGMQKELGFKDAQNKALNQFDQLVQGVPADVDGFNNTVRQMDTIFDQSVLWVGEEKERLRDDYRKQMLHQAVKGGYTQLFNSFEGSPTDKAKAAEAWLSSQELGILSADEYSSFSQHIRSLESMEYTRVDRAHSEADDSLETGFWEYVKDGDLASLSQAFAETQFHDPDRNKYWRGFIADLIDQANGGSGASTAKEEKEWAENQAAELRWRKENGDISQDQYEQGAAILYSNYGENANMAPVFRDLNDEARNPELKENHAYQYGEQYLDDQVKNLDLEEDYPGLINTIKEKLYQYAMDQGNDFVQTEKEYRKIVDSLILEPVIDKMNDTIRTGTFNDRNNINTSEQMTQAFQDGTFEALLRVDDETGEIDTAHYRDWVKIWGHSGKAENIDQFLKDYIDDFGNAAQRDFGDGAMISVDENTRRPIVETAEGVFVLQVVDDNEKKRLKGLDIDAKKNDEAWYRWNHDKGEFEYYQQVGK